MSVALLERPQAARETVTRWRRSAGPDNPAGPLYIGGAYVEADIITATVGESGHCSSCTASRPVHCC